MFMEDVLVFCDNREKFFGLKFQNVMTEMKQQEKNIFTVNNRSEAKYDAGDNIHESSPCTHMMMI